ncbi:MAG: hypothetical protein A3I66_24295 [Burkholderiales bacterium RIFCSPLOWO2_02_FULL_57_36]|nr:MAG: hypothetical protein A3I66_24295 [Burkholderiales bacterium RIFCSPLOWO2_02_FULL_57_36]
MTSAPIPAGALDFIVRRDDLHVHKFVPGAANADTQLDAGQILIKVDKFAFTSNNVTYAAFGDAMSYWNFFPAEDGWGRIPVWGFGDVVQSKSDGIKVGERFYGYFPMSDYVVMQPGRIGESGFSDAVAHRQAMHPLYNQYLRTAADPVYDEQRESEIALLRPLFVTSFMIDDFLDDNDFFGARAVVLSSASSKTAYGLAFLLAQRGRDRCEVIGLTSPGNVVFTEGLGCYHRVLTYDQIASLPNDVPVVYVDMAGNGKVRSALHHHFNDNMKYSCAVGGTHWDQREGEGRLPGARPILFFAPAQIKKRTTDWGPNGVAERLAVQWKEFLGPLGNWMAVIEGHGAEAVERVYREMLEGRARPDQGNMLSLSE